MSRSQGWWDEWFIGLARYVSTASKDPSTQVGAVIVDDRRVIIATGYNGLARGVNDTDERLKNRDVKYKMILHAEMNAVLFAVGYGHTIYTWPMAPCAQCASAIVQGGLQRVVSPKGSTEIMSRWGRDLELAGTIFHEAGVQLDLL